MWIAWQIFRYAAEPLETQWAGKGEEVSPLWKGLWVLMSNPKVVVFFGSVFVSMLPADPPLRMMLAFLVIVGFNEFCWYSAVALFFATRPIRRL